MAENLQRLCIVSGLYVDFAGADAGRARTVAEVVRDFANPAELLASSATYYG